jgi:hypothetical protein
LHNKYKFWSVKTLYNNKWCRDIIIIIEYNYFYHGKLSE